MIVRHVGVQLDDWEKFDIFEVAKLSNGKPLQTVGLALFRRYSLFDKHSIDEEKLCSFLKVCTNFVAMPFRAISFSANGVCLLQQAKVCGDAWGLAHATGA